MLQELIARQVLAAKRESACDRCPYANNVLQTLDWEFVDTIERQAIPSSCFFELVSRDLVGLEGAKNFFGRFLNSWVERAHPLLKSWCCP